MQNKENLIWLDMEMTGLNPDNDRILELAMVITNSQLEILDQSPVWVVQQSEETLSAMDEWNQKTHKKSGLIDRVRQSDLDENQVSKEAIIFAKKWVAKQVSPMCGNSICQDRRFMVRYMPELEAWFHYRNLDVSTLKELCRRWKPEVYKGFKKKSEHSALADIIESIEEMRFYRNHFICH